MMPRRRRWLAIAIVAVVVAATVGSAVAWLVAGRFVAQIEADLQLVCATPPAPPGDRQLPPLLAAFVARCGLPAATAGASQGRRWCRIEQRGEMRLAADGPWQPFTAVQAYAVAEPSFVWHADFPSFRVVDSLIAGSGRLEARLFSVVPVMRVEGEAATRAQLLRYLAEIVWVPAAIAGNRRVQWSAAGEREVIARMQAGAVQVELRFAFDDAGDIVRVSGMRERVVDDRAVDTPWLGTFSDYGLVGGVRVPRHGEVQWQIDGEPFVYWRGDVVALQLDR